MSNQKVEAPAQVSVSRVVPSSGAVITTTGMAGWVRRAFLRSTGFGADELRRGPVVGICSSWSELNPCNSGLGALAESVRRGVTAAGGTAVVFPTISLSEHFVAPSTMYLRNLMSMDVEEMIRCSPIDSVVLLAGCDKTVPAQLMGAVSADKPAIMLTAGPRSCASFRGKPVQTDDFWDLVAERQLGRIDDAEWDDLEGKMAASVGVCDVMGTATTMAILAEVLGMALPGSAVVPAVANRRHDLAYRTGLRAVEMATQGCTPQSLLTPGSFENALRVLAAIGGSTNAVIHLEAIAGRMGIRLGLDLLQRLSDETPQILGVRPSGAYTLDDFDSVGGVPALLAALAPLLDTGAATGDGRTIGEAVRHRAPAPAPAGCLRSLDSPFADSGGLVVVRGTLAPRGAIFKRSAAPRDQWRHTGPALVFDDYRDATRRAGQDPLSATEATVLVLRGAGPVGAPGMPEIGMVPIPLALRRRGVNGMVCVTDSRMSGTQHGATILHVTPEAAVGGPIGLVEDGDEIVFDADAGVLDLRVDARELLRRSESLVLPARPSRGYESLYAEHVLQADEGCDFDFLRHQSLQ